LNPERALSLSLLSLPSTLSFSISVSRPRQDTIKQREKQVGSLATLSQDALSTAADAEKLRMRGDRKAVQAKQEADEVRYTSRVCQAPVV
jgi:hypothetical protein